MKKNKWMPWLIAIGFDIYLWFQGGWARIVVYCMLALMVIVLPIGIWAEKAMKRGNVKMAESPKPED